MSILIKIVGFLIVLVVVLLAVGVMLPHDVKLERKILIAAPPEKVFPHINNFKRFNDWSPWATRDPSTVFGFEGPDDGVGAKMMWKSDHPDVNSGIQEITESVDGERVHTALDFGKWGTATASFVLAAKDGGTEVTWGFQADAGNNLMKRYFGLFYDRWIGPEYEKGLASLKELVEKSDG